MEPATKRRMALRTTQFGACAALCVLALRAPAPPPAALPAATPAAALPVPQAAAFPGDEALRAGLARIEVVVRRNDTLDAIFRRLALDLGDLAALRSLARVRGALDRLAPGDTLRLWHREGSVVALERDLSLTERLRVLRTGAGYQASTVPRPLERRVVVARGTITSSLFEAGDAAGLRDGVILQLAHVFGWDIDFAQGLRAGDAFALSYEQYWQDGRFVQDGALLAASFTNQGREVRAVRVTGPDGAASYYTPDGHSLQRAFLRAPLEFRRVSSRFSSARLHPILDRVRAHEGTDYAAPAGTPVVAAGDGRVQFAGVAGGYGNVLRIAHGGGIQTVYGHLQCFAPGVHAGTPVRQGQVIAFVGQTGLATGPHLHYEFRVDGRYQDPQRVRLPDAAPIDPALRIAFEAQAARAWATLAPATRPAAPAPAAAPATL